MRIGIDAHSLKDRAGIGRCARELLAALAESHGDHEIIVFAPEGDPWSSAIPESLARVRAATRSRIAWELNVLPALVKRTPLDLFHGLDFTLPPTRVPAVVTVYDVAFLERPELVSWRARLLYGMLAPRSARRAQRVVAPSQHAKTRIVAAMRLAPERVTVVPPGVSARFTPGAGPEAARARVPCRAMLRGRPYVLGVGTIQARKNFGVLAEAVARLRQKGSDVALVIAGVEVPGTAAIRRRIEREVGPDHSWIGRPEDEELADLYRGAAAVGVVSSYEGFGIPVLEAMACGAPVVTVAGGALEEAAGGAATLIERPDAEMLAETLLALMSATPDEAEARRRRGLERATALRWPEAARAMLEVYAAAKG